MRRAVRRYSMQIPYTIILAPNPSMMSGPGTNTIVLGGGADGAIVIDPAVDDAAYLDALVKEGSQRGGILRILITHGHPDHIGGGPAPQKKLGVPGFALRRGGGPLADGGNGGGTALSFGGDKLRALHTPRPPLRHPRFF